MDAETTPRAQEGFTLIELLVTIALISVAFVALFAGLSTFFAVSAAQRANANMDAVIRQYEEQVTSANTAYALTCPAPSTTYKLALPDASYAFSSGPTITYWTGTNASAFDSTCAHNALGIQKVTGTITRTITPTRKVSVTFTFIKRNPS